MAHASVDAYFCLSLLYQVLLDTQLLAWTENLAISDLLVYLANKACPDLQAI